MSVNIELGAVEAAGGQISSNATMYAGAPWSRLDPVDECGSSAAAAGFADMGAWLQMRWASWGEEVGALGRGLVSAAEAYEAADGVVEEAFDVSSGPGTVPVPRHAYMV